MTNEKAPDQGSAPRRASDPQSLRTRLRRPWDFLRRIGRERPEDDVIPRHVAKPRLSERHERRLNGSPAPLDDTENRG
jgi:hypothetical protein